MNCDPKTRRIDRCRLVFCLSIVILFAGLAPAQTPDTPPSTSDSIAVEAFFNEYVPALLAEHRVPGAVVALVSEGGLTFQAGYGFAALGPERPATAETPFATGSVAKLFTWLAVMQLVERGELDLDADVNSYLDFEIPDTFEDPITLRDLLAHTPGFEDYPMVGLFSRDAAKLPELGEIVSRRIPARIWPPGVETAYSNYGTGLAGYIVERAGGIGFATYVEREILGPLGMNRSTFEQPLPEDLAEEAALGYLPDGAEGFKPGGQEYVSLSPAGGMVMSASDAARFMLAHLDAGELDGSRVITEETADQMHATLFRDDPTLPGNAYGFWESVRHGEKILLHGGDTMLFHTQMALFLDRDVGFYLATNAPGGIGLREALWEAFLDHFYPVTEPLQAAELSAAEASRYTGLYGMNRASTTSLAKVASLFQVLRVSTEGDQLVTEFVGSRHTWASQGDGRFADTEREGELAQFRRGEDGRMVVHVSEAPMLVFRKLRWFETPQMHAALLVASSLLLLSGLIALPVMALRGRRVNRKGAAEERVKWLGALAALLLILSVVAFFAVMGNPMGPAFGLSPLLVATLVIGIAAALAVAGFTLMMIFAWLIGWWTLTPRVYLTVVAVAGLVLLWQMNYWNLLGFKV
ncbi:MAG: beta-lactamase family protein [Trueperaceae bacterium]|nr:MAG: beta-lactamase family protein [Trueperaceae bacterium]